MESECREEAPRKGLRGLLLVGTRPRDGTRAWPSACSMSTGMQVQGQGWEPVVQHLTHAVCTQTDSQAHTP